MAKKDSIMTFQRGTTNEIKKIDILDGQVLFDTDKRQILVDEENKRNIYAGKETANYITLGEAVKDYIYYTGTDGRPTAILSPTYSKNVNLFKIIQFQAELISELSTRIRDLEVLVNGGNLKDYAKVTALNDYIKKSELGFTLSGSNLTINKKY